MNTEIIKGENIKFKDYDNNIYLIKKGFADIQKKELIGKDIKVNLRNDLFGIIENEPKLAGNSISYKNNKTVIKKEFLQLAKVTMTVLPGK